MVLFGPQEAIRQAVTKCLVEAGPRQHILNVGHGVIEGTPEENVVSRGDIDSNSDKPWLGQLLPATSQEVCGCHCVGGLWLRRVVGHPGDRCS